MKPFNNDDPIYFYPTLYACPRCWGEQFAATDQGRPRCRHCGIHMVIKDDPTDEVPVLDRIADGLLHSGLDELGAESGVEHHNAARHGGGDGTSMDRCSES